MSSYVDDTAEMVSSTMDDFTYFEFVAIFFFILVQKMFCKSFILQEIMFYFCNVATEHTVASER